jgi:hypothetical protein
VDSWLARTSSNQRFESRILECECFLTIDHDELISYEVNSLISDTAVKGVVAQNERGNEGGGMIDHGAGFSCPATSRKFPDIVFMVETSSGCFDSALQILLGSHWIARSA